MVPKVSVVLPVYNAGKYLAPAIQSILGQSFPDFELLAINDGSTDGSEGVLASFRDPRLKIISQKNQGVRAALNAGLAAATGQYVARMDHDDISLPTRLAQQVTFLDSHPEHILVGTTYAYINEAGQITGIFPALLDDATIKRELLTKSPFGHGSVMIRNSVLREHAITYQADYTDDYDLWFQLEPLGRFANLPEILYLWRNISTGITNAHRPEQQREAQALRDRALRNPARPSYLSWPGWNAIRRYHNEKITLQSRGYVVARQSAHCSLYLNLAHQLVRHHRYFKAIWAGLLALTISPAYVGRTMLRLGRQRT